MSSLCREDEVTTGSQNNIAMYRSLTRGESSFRYNIHSWIIV